MPVVLQDGTYTYVYGLDLISATDVGGNQNYYMHNGLGSVTNMVDYNGNEKARYLYDAFGNTRYELELTPNVWRYTGEQQDDGTGYYYLRARYYDPFLGRFVSQDPAGAGHPYAYVENNPVNFVDPYGLFGCDTGIFGDPCDKIEDLGECLGNALDCLPNICGKEGGLGCVKSFLNSAAVLTVEFLMSDCGQALLASLPIAANFVPGGQALIAISVSGGVIFGLAQDLRSNDSTGLTLSGLEFTYLAIENTQLTGIFGGAGAIWDTAGCGQEVWNALN